jgi:uncharacterized membrane protein YhaH (DUF805 family)
MRKIKAFLHALLDPCVRLLAAFAVVSFVMGLMSSKWDATAFWTTGHVLPAWLVVALVLLFAAVVLVARRLHAAGEFAARGAAVLLAAACLADGIAYYRLLDQGRLDSAFAFPPTLAVAALLLLWVVTAGAEPYSSPSRTRRALWLRVVNRASS